MTQQIDNDLGSVKDSVGESCDSCGIPTYPVAPQAMTTILSGQHDPPRAQDLQVGTRIPRTNYVIIRG